MVTKQQVINALKKVMDPEIGISIVDLGLIREVKVKGSVVNIVMTLTSPFCPMASLIVDKAKEAAKVKGVTKVDIKLDLNKQWSPELMPKNAREKLGL